MIKTELCSLYGIDLPIVQAGMVWVSGGKLAAAASNAGCLGLIGTGSMTPDSLRQHIKKARQLTDSAFGVNVPLLYDGAKTQIDVALSEGVKIFFTSAGSPKKFTSFLKNRGAIVTHVVSNPKFARVCEDEGVDAVVAEGFEAGGHNGKEELTTLVLLQQICPKIKIPVIAAGGIASGQAILACLALGAKAVQIGTCFAATLESSAHNNFKKALVDADYSSTFLQLKKIQPVRLLKNSFSHALRVLEERESQVDDIKKFLGRGRARKGILEGDLEEGELEIGQIVSEVEGVNSCMELVQRLKSEYQKAKQHLQI